MYLFRTFNIHIEFVNAIGLMNNGMDSIIFRFLKHRCPRILYDP